MADQPDLSELVRRAMDANARFYQGWVNLSLEYFRGITEIFGGVQETISPPDSVETPAGAVVLEGEAGAEADGAFLVTNDLGRVLSCEFVATDFEDAEGNAVPARATFEPAKVDLEPGEQRVVRATVAIDNELEAGAAHTGVFGIKGMDGFSVPAVLRRTHSVQGSPIDRAEATAGGREGATAKGSGAAGGKKAASTKPAAAKKGGKKGRKKGGRKAGPKTSPSGRTTREKKK